MYCSVATEDQPFPAQNPIPTLELGAAFCRTAKIDITPLNPLEIPEWDTWMGSQPKATVFHSQGWARVLANTYGYVPEYLFSGNQERVDATLPLFTVRSRLTGTRGISLPFTDGCSPLYSPKVGFDNLLSSALKLGESRGWKYLEIRGTPAGTTEPSSAFYQHELDLTLPETKLFEACSSAMRRSIRKAEKSQIRVQTSSTQEAIEVYYRLHQITRQKHGLPPQSLTFFKNIQRHLIAKGCGTVLLTYLDQKPIAGAIFLHFGRSSIYKFGASDGKYQDLRPNNLLLWRGLLHLKGLGVETLSFGRTSQHQEGLRRFKLGFGANESMLHYFRYCFRSKKVAAPQSDQSSGWHTSLFRYCPRFVARFVGAALYPHIA